MSESNVTNDGSLVGDIAGRDIIHINISSNDNLKDNVELLVNSQRVELNNLVQSIAYKYFLEIEGTQNEACLDRTEEERKSSFASKLWKKVHAHLGVDGIKQIKRSQFQLAKDYIATLEVEFNQCIMSKRLVAEILLKVNKYNIFNESVDWCFCHFGKKRFKELTYEQLLETMKYINQYIHQLQSPTPKGLLSFIKRLFKIS